MAGNLYLEGVGWSVEREAIHGAGRTDLKACHSAFPGEFAVVEVKIWPRNDSESIHEQVVSYVSASVTAAAVVMIADKNVGWPATYAQKCLAKIPHEAIDVAAPIKGFTVSAKAELSIDHLLLELARRT